jgi:hypothetical protein
MIKDREVAKGVSELMLEIGSLLNRSVTTVQEHCSESETNQYRKIVGVIMGEMLLEVMNPIYRDHPDLKPPSLK